MPPRWVPVLLAAALLAGCLGPGPGRGGGPGPPAVVPGCSFAGQPWDDCDADADGIRNADEPDADRDGISDAYEAATPGLDPRRMDLCVEVLEDPDAPAGVPPRMQQEIQEAYAAAPLANPDGSTGVRVSFTRGTVASLDLFLERQEGPTTEPCIAAYVGLPKDNPGLAPGVAVTDARNPSLRVHVGNVTPEEYALDPAFFSAAAYNRTRLLLGHELAHFVFGCSDIPANASASGACGHTDPGALPCDVLNQPIGDCWRPHPRLFEAKRLAGTPLLGARPVRVTI